MTKTKSAARVFQVFSIRFGLKIVLLFLAVDGGRFINVRDERKVEQVSGVFLGAPCRGGWVERIINRYVQFQFYVLRLDDAGLRRAL